MQDFWLWFSTGFLHICDWKGYDHILFVFALCLSVPLSERKKLLILITAFTIGHSITLAFSVFDIVKIPGNVIEFLIPLTILVTCINNILPKKNSSGNMLSNYCITLFFGCIHGLGFSYLLKSLLGREEQIIGPLFSFNLGLEAGQILILSCIFLISLTLGLFMKIKPAKINLALSISISVIAMTMA
ncbi:MAG TPA: HupE/UreJ family protein, partial [Nitrosopumilaceae archaeon]|nr:HupE/UreJ family protein [Nitrosopumilaceae archaeon]